MKKRLLFTIFALILLILNGQVQAGSIDLVISSLNGQPISPPLKEIELTPSDVISIDVVYISGLNYSLFGLDVVAYVEGAGSGDFDISDVNWPEDYWEWSSHVYLNGDGLPVIDNVDFQAIPAEDEPVTVIYNILFHCTGAGGIHIALMNNPETSYEGTMELDEGLNDFIIEDFGTGIDINDPPEDRWPTDLQITGPDNMTEDSQQQYNATVYYNNGDTANVNTKADWNVDPNEIADVNKGKVTTGLVIYPQEMITLSAEYSDEDDIVVQDEIDIIVDAGCSIPHLIKRNLDDAKDLKDIAKEYLRMARQREAASFYILRDLQLDRDFSDFNFSELYNSRLSIFYAILQQRIGARFIDMSINKLVQVETILGIDPNSP